MHEATNDLKLLEERVAELDARRQAWKWTTDNPISPVEGDILDVLERLVNVYPNATGAERNHIREVMRNHPTVAMYLQAIATGDIRKFKSEIAPERLQPALIAVSMANSDFGDYRDLVVLLGSLWLRATQAGIDPAPFFQSVATLSDSEQPVIGEHSMREVLANFHSYAYLKEESR